MTETARIAIGMLLGEVGLLFLYLAARYLWAKRAEKRGIEMSFEESERVNQ